MLGFLVVVMIGPIAAVLSAILSLIVSVAAVVLALAIALLPFAVVGLLVWGVYQMGAPGNEPAKAAFKRRFMDFCRTFGRFTGQTCSRAYRAMRWTTAKSWNIFTIAGRGVRRTMQAIRETAAGRGRVLARMALEMACGAILATGICLALSNGAPEAFPVGIIGGALLGGAIGWSRPEKRVEPIH
jgi:hypothetical protein